MDNEYNYGNNEEKREEPARIEPPVPERWDNRGSCTDGTKNRAGEYIIL